MKKSRLIVYALLLFFVVMTQTGANTRGQEKLQTASHISNLTRSESVLAAPTTTTLVKDVWAGADSSYAASFVSYNSAIYFAASDGTSGRELWKYEGSTASLVADINESGDSDPQELFVYNGVLYFSADDGISGRELWKYDGSTADLVEDILPGSGDSIPGYFTIFDGELYFAATGNVSGRELWHFDGTTLTMVPDEINPSGNSYPQELIVYNDELYFAAADHWNGPDPAWELWKYDGTDQTPVADINPGDAGSNPNNFVVYNSKLYFAAIGSYDAGMELWQYDGVSATLVEDLWQGTANSSDPGDGVVFNNNLYFSARLGTARHLWKYNGSDASIVNWPCNTGMPVNGTTPVEMTVYAGALYFGAESCQGGVGRELWLLNSAGTISLVKDIRPGSDWSDPYYFAVANNILYFNANDGVHGTEMWSVSQLTPAAPTLISPLDDAAPKTLRPTFEWNTVSNATGYTIQISRNDAFTNIVTSTNLAGTVFTPGASLPRNSTLYWRVRAKNAYGSGSWSEVRSLATPNPPGVPVLVAPAVNSLNTVYTPLFKWNIVSLPTGTTFKHYQLQADNNPDFSSPEIDDTSVTDRLTPQWLSTVLSANTKFYWRVRSVNQADELSNWSAVWYFRSAMVPPVLNTPTDTQALNNVRPAFSWGSVDGASKYQLTVSQYANMSSPMLNVSIMAANYTPAGNLPASKTLYWRVRALGPNGPSLWSQKWSFTTGNPAGIPVLVAPANGSLTRDYTPTFNWNNVSLPADTTFKYYEIEVDDDQDFSSTEVHDFTALNDITDSDFTPDSDLDAGSRHYWRVRAINTLNSDDSEQFSTWSAVRSVRTVIVAPTLLSPANLSVGVALNPTFTWQAVDGATNYTIQASTVSSFSSLNLNSSTTDLSYTPASNLPANKQIYWRVRANGPNGPSAWSEVWTFNQPTVAIPTIASPANGASLRVPIVLQWNPAMLATKYQVRYVQPGSNDYVTQPEQTDLTFTLYQPDNWLWQVRAGDALGNWSDWSTPYSLEALQGAFSATPQITAPVSGTVIDTIAPQIKWTIPLHVGGWLYGTDLYRIQFDNNNDFTSPEYDKASNVSGYEGSLPDFIGVYTLVRKDWLPSLGNHMDIPPDGTYYVRIQGVTTDGLTSEWSTPITLDLQLSYNACSQLNDGPVTMNFSSGPWTENYPKMTSISTEDQLPDLDQLITISFSVIVEPFHTEPAPELAPITSVILYLSTDHKISEPITLTLASGTGTNGTWQGQWTADDSFCYRYRYLFQVTNAATTLPFDVVLRDGD